MNSTRGQTNLGSAPPMSHGDWAVARYNWYRACGLLDDLPQRTTETATYQRSPDPPPSKPHLKWYPLSKPDDDIAATYQQPVATTQRHRYSQRVDNAHAQTISTRDHAKKKLGDDPNTWSRGDWAVARYNWYRACGLLSDPPDRTAEIATYQKSPDPPPPKPHLKWYPLSKPDDDVATTYQRSVAASPSRRCQRVENAHAILARYQADQEEQAQGTGQRPPFVEADHNRVPKGSSHGGEFAPKTSLFQSNEGKHFLISTDDKWRHKPSPGLHVPTLPHDRVEKFLDLVEQGSALQGALSENYWKRSAVRNEIQSRGWSLSPSPHHLKSLKARQAELEREQKGLENRWSQLEAEYQQAGFRDHFVTGYRSGANAEYQQSSEEGKGLYKAVRAYHKTQEEDVRGGPGLEPTYDEMAIVSAPADIMAAYRLGSAVLRTGYHVVKQGGGYTLRKHVAKISNAATDDFGKWAKDASAKAIAREHVEGLLDAARRSEPAITKSMERAATSGDAVLERLGSRLKTEESLSRKIADRAMERNPGQLSIDQITSAVADAASRPSNTNDVLRYTVRSKSTKEYYCTYDAIKRSLKDQGFEEVRSADFWKRVGTSKEIGYRGINSTFRSPTGQLCEVQVHTPESLRMAEKLHHLYEEARAIGTSVERKEILDNLMKREWSNVPTPR